MTVENDLSSRIASDPVAMFVPWAAELERKLRRRLHNARNIAAARAVSTKSDNACSLYWMVNEVASAWVFAPATEEQLLDILDGLTRLFLVADMFQRIEGGGQ